MLLHLDLKTRPTGKFHKLSIFVKNAKVNDLRSMKLTAHNPAHSFKSRQVVPFQDPQSEPVQLQERSCHTHTIKFGMSYAYHLNHF